MIHSRIMRGVTDYRNNIDRTILAILVVALYNNARGSYNIVASNNLL
jgi:hypothetical protein